jgi:hypothetical protein
VSQAQGWWTIQASAALETVATRNYACFGRSGVPRFPAPDDAPAAPSPDPAALCVEMIVRAPDGSARLANLDVTLSPQEQTAQRVIWTGYDPAQHVQTIWVWDFFRLLSHIVLRVADPPPDSEPDSAWQTALDSIRAMNANDVIALDVRSACGDIHQQHTVIGSAIRWEPAT